MSELLTFGSVGDAVGNHRVYPAAVGNHCRYPAEQILEIRYYCPVGAARRHGLGYNSTVSMCSVPPDQSLASGSGANSTGRTRKGHLKLEGARTQAV